MIGCHLKLSMNNKLKRNLNLYYLAPYIQHNKLTFSGNLMTGKNVEAIPIDKITMAIGKMLTGNIVKEFNFKQGKTIVKTIKAKGEGVDNSFGYTEVYTPVVKYFYNPQDLDLEIVLDKSYIEKRTDAELENWLYNHVEHYKLSFKENIYYLKIILEKISKVVDKGIVGEFNIGFDSEMEFLCLLFMQKYGFIHIEKFNFDKTARISVSNFYKQIFKDWEGFIDHKLKKKFILKRLSL